HAIAVRVALTGTARSGSGCDTVGRVVAVSGESNALKGIAESIRIGWPRRDIRINNFIHQHIRHEADVRSGGLGIVGRCQLNTFSGIVQSTRPGTEHYAISPIFGAERRERSRIGYRIKSN